MSRRHRLGLGIGGRSGFREPRLEGRQDRRRNGSGTASRRAWQPGLAGYRGLRRYSRLGTSLDGRRLGRGLQRVQNGLGVTAGLGQPPLSILSVLVHAASADTVLVSYGFDGKLPTAQEGFYIFENSRGYVEPTDQVKFSGYRSLEPDVIIRLDRRLTAEPRLPAG